MAFNSKKQEEIRKALGLTWPQYNLYGKRGAGLMNKQFEKYGHITPAMFKNAFFILLDILENPESNGVKTYAWGMDKPLLAEYGSTIEALYEDLKSFRKVSIALEEQYGVFIGKSKIGKFLKENGLSNG